MNWLATGLVCCAASVAAGAFGAHGLKGRLDPAALALWETAARYLMYGGLALALLGVSGLAGLRSSAGAGWSLLVGVVIFSGTVALLALGGPRWLGAITPVGGTLLILGFALFAWSALR